VAAGKGALTLRGHTENVNEVVTGVAFSPDARLLVTAFNGIKIWQAKEYAPEVKAIRDRAAAQLARSWHQRAALECWTAKPCRWFGIAFHVSRLLDEQPANSFLYVYRGDALAAQGLWQQAVDDYARGIELGATHPWPALQQTWLRLQLGDRDGYRRACTALLKRFGQTEQVRLANDVAWTCVLAPTAAADLEQPLRLAEKAVAAVPESADYRSTLGALSYRAGRFPAALKCLQEAVQRDKEQGACEAWLFLAMTHRALGQDAEARRWLDKAVKAVEVIRGEMLKRTDHTLLGMARLIQLQILRREVEALLAGK
jgi:tetratricopeptide (TPR) repeat protein